MPVTGLRSKWVRGFLVFYADADAGRMRIGETDDFTYGGDISNDDSGDGILVESADGFKHFALDVYADDGGTALTAGWVSTGFFNFKNYAAVTGSINLSTFGLTGQLHIGASMNTIAQHCGIFGIMETVSGVTLANANFFGGFFAATIPSGATLASGAYGGAIIVSGSHGGTISGNLVGIHFMNPSGAQFDYAFSFGQNSAFAGVVAVGAVGGSQTHKLKVLAGGTDYFIPMNTA